MKKTVLPVSINLALQVFAFPAHGAEPPRKPSAQDKGNIACDILKTRPQRNQNRTKFSKPVAYDFVQEGDAQHLAGRLNSGEILVMSARESPETPLGILINLRQLYKLITPPGELKVEAAEFLKRQNLKILPKHLQYLGLLYQRKIQLQDEQFELMTELELTGLNLMATDRLYYLEWFTQRTNVDQSVIFIPFIAM